VVVIYNLLPLASFLSFLVGHGFVVVSTFFFVLALVWLVALFIKWGEINPISRRRFGEETIV
jgi:hypothetical protein